MHPLARPSNQSGAFDMNAGDRVVHTIDDRHGVADEFLHDGDALVSFDDGSFDTVKWAHLRRETPAPMKPRAATYLDAIDAPAAPAIGKGRLAKVYHLPKRS